ncbi:hypothetical protein [Sinimarinibacterium sp. NLF-5-8]|uniref:hypothetical protein n=1 Tax=Sinimarinibacterium sp. NLF-5-8 TaxID=2698684 RepID=UPI00137BCAE0|nr:hypothetical protein [Sinimarinibacterium sp. NLF-5-8]QHS09116.1 hypothetical protein GT972_02410 [Sinimarinibacterium sp. NLF-5-8]
MNFSFKPIACGLLAVLSSACATHNAPAGSVTLTPEQVRGLMGAGQVYVQDGYQVSGVRVAPSQNWYFGQSEGFVQPQLNLSAPTLQGFAPVADATPAPAAAVTLKADLVLRSLASIEPARVVPPQSRQVSSTLQPDAVAMMVAQTLRSISGRPDAPLMVLADAPDIAQAQALQADLMHFLRSQAVGLVNVSAGSLGVAEQPVLMLQVME